MAHWLVDLNDCLSEWAKDPAQNGMYWADIQQSIRACGAVPTPEQLWQVALGCSFLHEPYGQHTATLVRQWGGMPDIIAALAAQAPLSRDQWRIGVALWMGKACLADNDGPGFLHVMEGNGFDHHVWGQALDFALSHPNSLRGLLAQLRTLPDTVAGPALKHVAWAVWNGGPGMEAGIQVMLDVAAVHSTDADALPTLWAERFRRNVLSEWGLTLDSSLEHAQKTMRMVWHAWGPHMNAAMVHKCMSAWRRWGRLVKKPVVRALWLQMWSHDDFAPWRTHVLLALASNRRKSTSLVALILDHSHDQEVARWMQHNAIADLLGKHSMHPNIVRTHIVAHVDGVQNAHSEEHTPRKARL